MTAIKRLKLVVLCLTIYAIVAGALSFVGYYIIKSNPSMSRFKIVVVILLLAACYYWIIQRIKNI